MCCFLREMPFTSTSFFLPHTHSTCFSHVTKEENQAQEYEQFSPGHAPCIGCSCNIKPHSGTMPNSCKELGLKTYPLLPFTICWKEEESLPPRRPHSRRGGKLCPFRPQEDCLCAWEQVRGYTHSSQPPSRPTINQFHAPEVAEPG